MAAIAYPFYGPPPRAARRSRAGRGSETHHLRLVEDVGTPGRERVAPIVVAARSDARVELVARPESAPVFDWNLDAATRRAVERHARTLALRRQQLRRRQIAVAFASFASLVGLWFGVGTLTSAHASSVVVPAGAVAVHGGFRYVVRPGDTLWSIASSFEPGADPRALVDRLSAQISGGTLVAGETLVLP